MPDEPTTQVIQDYLDQIAKTGDNVAASVVVQKLLERAATRLQMLGDSMLRRSYPRLTRPPANIQSEELLGGIVERLIKALAHVQPQSVRQFFAMANQHLRWELNDLARRLDEVSEVTGVIVDAFPAPESHGSELSANARLIFDAIEKLPLELQETFDLIRIQGLTQAEAAKILEVSPKTVQRRLASSLIQLNKALKDLALPSNHATP